MGTANIDEYCHRVVKDFRLNEKRTSFFKTLDVSDESIKEFVASCYYASLISDEGRWPKMTLVSYEALTLHSVQVVFENKIDLTPNEIAKLAPAIADGYHLAVIASEERLIGYGISHPKGNPFVGMNDPLRIIPLTIEIVSPGHIEAACGGDAIMYKNGSIEIVKVVQRCMTLAIVEGLARDKYDNKTIEHDFRRNGVEAAIGEIVKKIVDLKHGGMILFMKEFDPNAFTFARYVNKAFLFDYHFPRYWENQNRFEEDPGENSENMIWVNNSIEALRHYINTISQLAEMDGALVFDYSLKLIAFNAMTKVFDVDYSKYEYITSVELGSSTTSTFEEICRNKGTRHRAALNFVTKHDSSSVFVISQDGSISAFNQMMGSFRCEIGMRAISE